MLNILVIDNQVSFCNLMKKFLTKLGYKVKTSTQVNHAIEMLGNEPFQFVISDYRLPHIQGDEFFETIKSINPDAAVIFTSNEVNLKNVVSIIKRGASDYLSKPINPDELVEVLKRNENSPKLIEKKVIKEGNPKETPSTRDYVMGKSKNAKETQKMVETVGPTDFTVIIQGETGTGKESYANLIHKSSKRRDMPFVAVDCGCLTKDLAGSELFGHEKGAFTGAVTQKIGFFEMANGGTIFLDEIANLSSEIQTSLLRALQEKVIRRIGGTCEIPIDVRIIAATNEDLLYKSETSSFREDLYYRLSEFVLSIHPLRNRKEDVPEFIDFFLKQTAFELGRQEVPEFEPEAFDYLMAYHWPGNIRELRNVIRRSCLFINKHNMIPLSAVPIELRLKVNRPEVRIEEDINLGDEKYDLKTLKTRDLKSVALEAESEKIIEVLKDVKYNKTKAAEKLNIHRKTLYSKLKTLNISY
ncbi:sigma-54 dependent transcriptional regulator [Belliella sp. DSM 111904]|uniref:Sigma-54 dependent transcriptional regulator n=1 Tax=Belliella filtrata TaxID=2923435 RepID=A0ABS9V315_9BACT|nr:sigma-54 dependent transcriptional regulator [Belliella filtrata]MCH7410595.1 sigma-54 dependent transcriptional regulator [Belliella filtrata]